jgi:hypothetical protein
MTQEDKGLLLKDLCARLPYGVKVWYKYYPTNITKKFATSIRLADDKLALSRKLSKEGDWYPIEEAGEILIKPYLRPMSSMTDEESEELPLDNEDVIELPEPSPEYYEEQEKILLAEFAEVQETESETLEEWKAFNDTNLSLLGIRDNANPALLLSLR